MIHAKIAKLSKAATVEIHALFGSRADVFIMYRVSGAEASRVAVLANDFGGGADLADSYALHVTKILRRFAGFQVCLL